ncbi:MAG: hypothetical protein AAGM84_14310 [Pseudomonadota bacterium]
MTALPLWLRYLMRTLWTCFARVFYAFGVVCLLAFLLMSLKKLFLAGAAAWPLWPSFRPFEAVAALYAGWHAYHDAHDLAEQMQPRALPLRAWLPAGATVFDQHTRRPVAHL